MYQPDLKTIEDLAAQGYNLIPIYREVQADLETPVSAFLKIARGPYSFLLESVEGGERQARYTFMGTEPYRILRTGPGTDEGEIDPLTRIESELGSYAVGSLPGLPRFTGGAIGYLAYECARYSEPRIPAPELDPLGVPESILMFTDTVLVFDHVKHVIMVVSHVHVSRDLPQEYSAAIERIERLVSRLSEPLKVTPKPIIASKNQSGPVSNMTQNEYEEIVKQVKAYIVAGDVIQVVPSHRLSQPTSADPFDVYRALRALNPSPYMFFLSLDEFHIIGASPETLVRVENGIVYNFPLAGTIRRGDTEEEDNYLSQKLREDEKEQAEHIMLVDLGRNDLGRVAEPGSVTVTDFMRVVRYSHVMHLESEIHGKLRSDKSIYDAVRACLPAGTLSGAPKIRAMEIIADLEGQRRGIYGGAVGYFGFQDNMDVCIPIRTVIQKDGVAHVQAGAGIVYDSQPESEYKETMVKAQAPLRAIQKAELI